MNVTRLPQNVNDVKKSHNENSRYKPGTISSKTDENRKSRRSFCSEFCQLTDLCYPETYRVKELVDEKVYQKEEIIFDFEEEFYGHNCLNESNDITGFVSSIKDKKVGFIY